MLMFKASVRARSCARMRTLLWSRHRHLSGPASFFMIDSSGTGDRGANRLMVWTMDYVIDHVTSEPIVVHHLDIASMLVSLKYVTVLYGIITLTQ